MLWYFNPVDSHTFTDDAMDVDVTIVVLALCKERQSVSTPSHYSFDHLQYPRQVSFITIPLAVLVTTCAAISSLYKRQRGQ